MSSAEFWHTTGTVDRHVGEFAELTGDLCRPPGERRRFQEAYRIATAQYEALGDAPEARRVVGWIAG